MQLTNYERLNDNFGDHAQHTASSLWKVLRSRQIKITVFFYGLAGLNYYIGHVSIPDNSPCADSLSKAKALIALEVYVCIGVIACLQLYLETKPLKSSYDSLTKNEKARHVANSVLSLGVLGTTIVFSILTFTASAEKQSGTILAIAAGVTLVIGLTYAIPKFIKCQEEMDRIHDDLQNIPSPNDKSPN